MGVKCLVVYGLWLLMVIDGSEKNGFGPRYKLLVAASIVVCVWEIAIQSPIFFEVLTVTNHPTDPTLGFCSLSAAIMFMPVFQA